MPDSTNRRSRMGWALVIVGAIVAGAGRFATARGGLAPDAPTHWVGTWAAAAQATTPGRADIFHNQTLRLVVHTSIGGRSARITISNTFGDRPLVIGGAHVARRTTGAAIDPASDRVVSFRARPAVTIPPGGLVVSDAVDVDVAPLADLAISVFLPEATAATTSHVLALQTSYASTETGDSTGSAAFPVGRTITTWPFLTEVDVAAPSRTSAIVAFGSSTTDGDGSTRDANRRWPDVLAERLQKSGGAAMGVLNEGIIGNRLLFDIQSPRQDGGPFEPVLRKLGPELGESGIRRFDRDVLGPAGVRYVVLVLGINDILFPGAFTPASGAVSARDVIDGNRELVARARKANLKVIATTIPPFEGAMFRNPSFTVSTAEKEQARQAVNAWIRTSGEFDGVADFDEVVRDPAHPTRLRADYDSGDHLHVNDAANVAQAGTFELSWFRER